MSLLEDFQPVRVSRTRSWTRYRLSSGALLSPAALVDADQKVGGIGAR